MLKNIDKNTSREEATVAEWLNLQRKNYIRKKPHNSEFFYIRIIKNGLASRSVNSFVKHSKLPKAQLSKIIHVSSRTLQRNAPEKKLNTNISEKLVELARLYFKGIEVFGDREKFNLWLQRPNISFANKKPVELLETSIGIELVSDEILRIEYGVFS